MNNPRTLPPWAMQLPSQGIPNLGTRSENVTVRRTSVIACAGCGGMLRGMKTISVSELHEHTAEWVQAVRVEPVLIAERGSPVARLEPWPATGRTLRERQVRPGFARLAGRLGPKSKEDDVTRFISEERDAR